MAKKQRRDKGEGSLFQRHTKDCPPAVPTKQPDGTTKRERPKHRCNGLWIARVELEDGENGKRRVAERARKRYDDAVKVLRELRKQVDQHGTITTGGMTVETWLWKWHAEFVSVNEAPSTVASYRSVIKTQLVPILGRRRLDQLTPAHVRDMHKTLRSRTTRRGVPLAESSVLKAHNVLSSSLEDAKKDGKVVRNVAKLVDRPTFRKVHQGQYTNEEVQRFLRVNADQSNIARLAFAFFTGVRQGEVIGMEDARLLNLTNDDLATARVTRQLQRVKFKHGCKDGVCGMKRAGSCPDRELNIRPGLRDLVTQLDGGLCLVPVKSLKGEREVALHPFIAAVLVKHIETRPPNPHGLLFSRPDGRPLAPEADLIEWKAALARAGLVERGTHVARRTAATELRKGGTDRKVMRDALGHASDTSTDAYLGNDSDNALARIALTMLGDQYVQNPEKD